MEYEILKVLKAADTHVSGSALGESLGVTRTAIWKGIQKLREEGYAIEAVNNKGYRLLPCEEPYNVMELKEGLKTHRLGKQIYFYKETDSTNLRIRALGEENAPEGTVAVAEIQRAGRGRREKYWESPFGTGVWMSFLLCPSFPPTEAPLLTLVAGLAVCKAIRKQTGILAEIKWPNDVLVNGKKVCGILTELNGEIEQIRSVIVGIGVNVNMDLFPEALQKTATSLKIENGGQSISRKKIFQSVLEEFEPIYEDFLQQGFASFSDEYKEMCCTLGQQVNVICKEPFEGQAVDLTPQGELVVRKDNGEEVVVYSGEVSIRKQEDA